MIAAFNLAVASLLDHPDDHALMTVGSCGSYATYDDVAEMHEELAALWAWRNGEQG
jgi:hypothetical protein